MSGLRQRPSPWLAAEWVFAGLIILSVVRAGWFATQFGYLPPPFFYEPSDTYADWFNTAFWARDGGAYDVWTTLYPPLSFVLIRPLTLDSCYPRTRAWDPSAGLAPRECDWLGIASIWGFWLIAVVILYLAFRKFDRSTAIPRTICVGLGWPLLNAIERGNLLLIAFPFFLLAIMPLVRSAKWRWVFAGLSINLKVYLIAPFLAQLIMRRWRWVEGVLLATIIIYLASFALLGQGNPVEIVRNLTAWSDIKITNPLDFWPATTYAALYSLMESESATFPAVMVIGTKYIEIIQSSITILLRSTQAILLLAMIATWLRPEAVTRYRIYLLGLLFALITSEAGGYTPALFMALIMVERAEGFGRRLSILLCYIMAISFDWIIQGIAEVQRDSYLSGQYVSIDMGLTVWPFLRPLVIQIIAIAMACTTIRQVWHDVQVQGWATRPRYWQDDPILPLVLRPERPDRQDHSHG